MGLLDGILGQVVGGGGDNGIVADIAQKVGLTPAEAESAIGARRRSSATGRYR